MQHAVPTPTETPNCPIPRSIIREQFKESLGYILTTDEILISRERNNSDGVSIWLLLVLAAGLQRRLEASYVHGLWYEWHYSTSTSKQWTVLNIRKAD